MSLKTIRLELARDAAHPEGSIIDGYEFRAPLTPDGHLEEKSWARTKAFCTVRRFANGRDEEQGLLMKGSRGQWYFSYELGEDDDEPVFRLTSHRFVPGEYVSITDHGGLQRTFKVTSVQDWSPSNSSAVH